MSSLTSLPRGASASVSGARPNLISLLPRVRARRRVPLLLLGCLIAAACTRPLTATQLLLNGNFETGSFASWTVGSTQVNPFQASFNDGLNAQIVNSVSGQPAWFLRNVGSNYFGTPASPINGYTAFNGFDGSPGQFFLQQSFAFGGAANVVLDFDFAVQTNYSGLPRTFSVNLLNPGGTILATVYSAIPPPNITTWSPTHVYADLTTTLSGLGAGTYQLQFLIDIPQSFTGPATFGIDNIALDSTATGMPEGGATAVLLGCSFLGIAVLQRRGASRLAASAAPSCSPISV
jgi:hypothetical protein